MKLLLLSLLLLILIIQISHGCLPKRQGPRQKLPKPDLTDEKDDGQSLTLVHSENIIVPPEEDGDPTDDQAPDLDKNEDLEDLDRVIEVHLDDEVYDLSSMETSEKHAVSSTNCANHIPFLHHIKTNSSQSDKLGNLKIISRFAKNFHSTEVEKVSKSKLKDGVVREPTNKENFRLEGETLKQMLIILMIVLAFLFCLLTTICSVLLIKIKLLNRPRPCKSSKTSLIKELEQEVLWEV